MAGSVLNVLRGWGLWLRFAAAVIALLASFTGAAFAQPAVSVVLPNSDPLVGETIVTITSSGFDGAAP